jgi:hypothetical protein
MNPWMQVIAALVAMAIAWRVLRSAGQAVGLPRPLINSLAVTVLGW